MSEPLLEVQNLVRHYERPRRGFFSKKPVLEALKGVSFTVNRGESFGIVGESGSGKSTLAKAILAIEEPTSGAIRFMGENLFALPADKRRAMRRHVQMVFQDPFGSLDPRQSVREIVTEPLDLLDEIRADEWEPRAVDALQSVGLQAGDLDKFPHEFSGGQRQRIAIARALITRPDLIVADEPVSALDVSVQAQVLNLMMDLQEQFGLTYIIISHDLSVVRHVTDRLAVMEAGRIVEQGETAEIFANPQHLYTQELLDSMLDLPDPASLKADGSAEARETDRRAKPYGFAEAAAKDDWLLFDDPETGPDKGQPAPLRSANDVERRDSLDLSIGEEPAIDPEPFIEISAPGKSGYEATADAASDDEPAAEAEPFIEVDAPDEDVREVEAKATADDEPAAEAEPFIEIDEPDEDVREVETKTTADDEPAAEAEPFIEIDAPDDDLLEVEAKAIADDEPTAETEPFIEIDAPDEDVREVETKTTADDEPAAEAEPFIEIDAPDDDLLEVEAKATADDEPVAEAQPFIEIDEPDDDLPEVVAKATADDEPAAEAEAFIEIDEPDDDLPEVETNAADDDDDAAEAPPLREMAATPSVRPVDESMALLRQRLSELRNGSPGLGEAAVHMTDEADPDDDDDLTAAPIAAPAPVAALAPVDAPAPIAAKKPDLIRGQALIDGRWRDAVDGGEIDVINPSDGVLFGHLVRGGKADIDLAVQAARRAVEGPWGRMPAVERGRVLSRLAGFVLDHVDHLANLEARDVGKPLRQARADAVALARYFEFYGGSADKVHGQTIPYQDGYTVMTLREPHGVTGHIVPWNYPMQIIGRSVGAALAMGNACVLKPGEDASLTALEIGQFALDAGLPAGALNIVTGLGEEAGAALAAHPGIDHLSFTGSVETGRLVQRAAAGHTCPVTLELGGKSPQLVFADADLDQALPFLVNAAIQNAGQTCSAGSRVLIQDSIYDEVAHRLAVRFDNLQVGPAVLDLDVGPVINPGQKERIERYLDHALEDLDILAEGDLTAEAQAGGYYVRPTLLGNVPSDHLLAQEEIFGPVLTAIRFSKEEDAIRIANDSAYGLVAGVWTKDGARQMRLARALKTGQVFINNYGAGGGVELPFGGVKSSGFGREKGFEALYGFSTLKTIAMHHG